MSPGPTLDRRTLLQALLATGLIGPSLRVDARPQDSAWRRRWPWALDVDGDRRITEDDLRVVQALLGQVRGTRPRAGSGWNPAADVLARGRIDTDALGVLREHLGLDVPVRPQLACWHYGWYRRSSRRRDPVTVRYRGGDYSSSSSATEEEFHRLKAEFGIDIDLLSWIDTPQVLGAYQRGYLSARNLELRRFGLLYEPLINMNVSGRIDLSADSEHTQRLIADFRSMGEWMARAARHVQPALYDGRPLVYVFGSHTFGHHGPELAAAGRALTRARAAFTESYGTPPFLIGDEAPFPADERAGSDREYRATWFDAITRYHHYDEGEARSLADGGDFDLDAAHRERLTRLERRAMEAFRGTRNRFTNAPLLVVPSSAAGFAKRGMPRLRASREDYAAWLRDAQALTDEHIASAHGDRIGTAALPAPLVIVGSWNEEYEGHALMPASSNAAMRSSDEGGFEWLHALQELYGPSRLALRG